MATRQSNRREFDDDIWKFLDHEESDYQTIGEVRDRTQSQPSREFLRPAVFRSSLASVDSQHDDMIQLPTFAQKFNGNVPDGSIKPTRSPHRLPRTVFKGEDEEDPNALYGVPKKLLRGSASSSGNKRDSFDSIINDHPGFSGSLFKRYEAGSILSTISSEQPPVVYHHDSHETIVREREVNPGETYRDDVVFSRPEDLLWAVKLERKNAGGGKCSCCSGKVVVAVVAAVLVVVAVVAIAVGVSLSTTSNNNSGPNSNSAAETTRPVVTASPGVTVTKLNTWNNCNTIATNETTVLVELFGSLEFHGGNFPALSIDFNETSGNATWSICKAFESSFCTLNQSDIAYQNCTILRYTNGSIIAEFQIFLIKRSNLNNDTAIQLLVKEALNTAGPSLCSIFLGVNNVSLINDTLTILPASIGITPSKVANTKDTTSLSGNGLTTNPASSVPTVSNNTTITMVTDTSQLPQSDSTNSANSTSASDMNESISRIQVSVTTPLSQIGTATNGVVSPQTSHSHFITDTTPASQKITTSEIITKFKTTPSDGVTYRTTGEPVRISKTLVLASNSWARASASLTGSKTTSRVPATSSEVVTTSQAKTES